MSPEESELIAQWRAGDSSAGERLVIRHFEPLLRFVRSKIDDRSAVDDIVQETWTAVLVRHKSLEIRTTFRHYLLGIAVHKIFKCLRLRLGARERELPTMSIEDLAPSLGSVIDAKSQQKLLVAALRSLPIEQQVILELYVWEEMTANEIAELLEMSVPQVRHRIREGKGGLERYLRRAERPPNPSGGEAEELSVWVKALRERARSGFDDAEPRP